MQAKSAEARRPLGGKIWTRLSRIALAALLAGYWYHYEFQQVRYFENPELIDEYIEVSLLDLTGSRKEFSRQVIAELQVALGDLEQLRDATNLGTSKSPKFEQKLKSINQELRQTMKLARHWRKPIQDKEHFEHFFQALGQAHQSAKLLKMAINDNNEDEAAYYYNLSIQCAHSAQDYLESSANGLSGATSPNPD